MEKETTETRSEKQHWDSLWRNRKRMYVYRNVVKIAEEFLGGLAGRTVLEVGCGRGATLLELARRGADVVGLDYSEEAIAVCRAWALETGTAERVEFVKAEAQKMPFESESFDFVFSVGLLEHFKDPMEILREQYRVLRPGGYCLVQVPQKYSIYTIVKKTLIGLGKWPYGGWETQFSDRELSELMSKAGLDPHYVTGYGSFILAAVRHAFAPKLDFGMMWRNGTELDVVRAVKAKTALDICIVAKKRQSFVCDSSQSTKQTGTIL
jgi:ubiquinone/menaquinone biosynthesis C-methylase UbiE